MLAPVQRYCFHCGAVVNARALDLGIIVCDGRPCSPGCQRPPRLQAHPLPCGYVPACGAPLIPAYDNFMSLRFMCLKCHETDDIAVLEERFQHDPYWPIEDVGVFCNDCFDAGAAANGRSHYRTLVDERPSPRNTDGRVSEAAREVEQFLQTCSKKRRAFRRQALDQYASRNREHLTKCENLFMERVIEFPRLMRRNRNEGTGEGWRWRSQQPLLDLFIVDFVEETTGLAVELDGPDHLVDPKFFWDQVRDKILTRHGYTVIRIWNDRIRYLEALDYGKSEIVDERPRWREFRYRFIEKRYRALLTT